MSARGFGGRGLRPGLVALVALLALSGCTGDGPAGAAEVPPEPFAACPVPVSVSVPVSVPGAAGDLVPDLSLPCFTGGGAVSLRSLGKPALINLWASWCGPCRKELPALQSFADLAGDRAIVLGVITGDQRSAAAYAAVDFGVSFPSVVDDDAQLRSALGILAIPATLFVDETGVVRFIDKSGALTLETVKALASDHLGVST